MGFFDFLFLNKTQKIQDYNNRGAIILDVRSKKEYESGAIAGSKHIPLSDLNSKIEDLKKMDKPFITCCASGVRSASAARILNSNGMDAINGGGWFSLNKKL